MYWIILYTLNLQNAICQHQLDLNKTGGKKEQTSDTYRRLDLKKHDAERKTTAFTQLFHDMKF